ncbi:MAG TPA: molybdenum ABC transporter ATP-binding protein [Methylophilaceae bacterium]|nr:molybdenum ABC transporter ATP-binding protein [Methylophilaceae bacterium]
MIDIDVTLQRPGFRLEANCLLDAPVTGLLGASGAGKSTLLGILAGFITPDHGHVIHDGDCLFDDEQGIDVPVHQRRIGMVFQDSRLFPHLSVRENLRFGMRMQPKEARQFSYRQIVELLEIGHLQSYRAHQLSGGEKQRVALGRALLASPRLLLLDEPLASLDVHLKGQILPFLKRVKEEIGIPMLFVSHAVNEVLYLTNQVAMMQQGRVLGTGDFHQVMQDERTLRLAHTLGLENLVRGKLVQNDEGFGYSVLQLGQQPLYIPLVDLPLGSEVSASIPASAIALAREKLNGVSIQNQLVGRVTAMHEAGGRVLVSVDVGCPLLVEITTKALHEMQIEVGASICCLFKTQSVTLLQTG